MTAQNDSELNQSSDWLNRLTKEAKSLRDKRGAEAADGVLLEDISPKRAVEAAVKHMIEKGYEVADHSL